MTHQPVGSSGPPSLERFLDVAQVMMLGLDTAGRVTLINPKGCEILGYVQEEILGKNWFDHFLPEEALDQVKNIFHRTVTGQIDLAPYYENEVVRKDGTRRLVAWHNGMDCNAVGQVRGVYASGIDITDRDRLTRKNKQLTDQLVNILEGLDALVYVSDMQTYELLYLNKYAKNEVGDGVGKLCYETLQGERTTPCEFCTNDKLVGPDGQPTGPYIWEFQNTRNKRWYKIADRAIQWNEGRLARLEIATDISDLKYAEARNQALIAKLERALDEVDALRGIIPICSFCKKIRDDQGFWNRVEKYIEEKSGAEFSHGICPDCLKEHYPNQ